MRQRHVRGIEGKLAAYAGLILHADEPESVGPACDKADGGAGYAVRWYQRGSGRYKLPEGFARTYVEFGCGRGRFIGAMAEADPEGLYIGVEGCKTIVLRALEKTRAAELTNVRYIDAFINDATGAFAENSVDGVFLNFSDPWPKDRHADRRLTAPKKAEAYLRILKPGGFVCFKTDGEAFFDYSLRTFTEAGFHIGPATRDLWHDQYCTIDDSKAGILMGAEAAEKMDGASKGPQSAAKGDIITRAAATLTEYELRFRAIGQPIFHFAATKNRT